MAMIEFLDSAQILWYTITIPVSIIGTIIIWSRRYWVKFKFRQRYVPPEGRKAAIAIGVSGTDITRSVEDYLADEGVEMPVFKITRKGQLDPGDFPRLFAELREIKQQLSAAGVREVHIFCAAPVAFGFGAGAIVDNWVPAVVYHWQDGNYTPLYVVGKDVTVGPRVPEAAGWTNV